MLNEINQFNEHLKNEKRKECKLFLYGVVIRLRYAIGNLGLAMVFVVLLLPLNLAYILTGKDYALQYIKWAHNVFQRP